MFNDMNVFIIINNISVNSIGFILYRIPGYIESYYLIFLYHIILSFCIVLSYLILYHIFNFDNRCSLLSVDNIFY